MRSCERAPEPSVEPRLIGERGDPRQVIGLTLAIPGNELCRIRAGSPSESNSAAHRPLQ